MKITEEQLKEILEAHQKYLNNDPSGTKASLCHDSLSGADLCNANINDTDFVGANLDCSCWPLWCGSLRARIDDHIACQLIYHVCSTIIHSPAVNDEIKHVMLSQPVIDIANQFHRADECGALDSVDSNV